jgi:ribosomal protein S18 acetylase RimI-like enzyme
MIEPKLCVFQRLSEMPDFRDRIPQTAQLVYDSGGDYFDTLFGSRELAVVRLAAWISRASSGFSYDRITLALIDDAIAGITLGLGGKDLPDRQKSDILHFIKETGSSQRETVRQKADVIRAMTPSVKSDEYYLRSISVSEAHRGRGLGRALLEQFINHGLGEGYCRFRLDVRGDNSPAINLYRTAGFHVSEEFSIPQTGWKLCSMLLEKPRV